MKPPEEATALERNPGANESFEKPPVSPCNKPMRKRDSVMEKMGCEQKWARMGVKAVMEPQAAADSRRTFSPPTL